MRAGRGRRSRRSAAISACLTLLVMGLVPTVSLSRVVAAPSASAASQTHCKSQLQGAPCKGPIQTLCSYSGLGSGDDTYIWAKAQREIPLGRRLKTFPPPAYYVPVSKRTFVWHARSGIEVVAVYIVHSLTRKYTYQKVSLKKHEVTLTTNNEDANPPLLLLEGRHKT
jgi:hypothetical protein